SAAGKSTVAAIVEHELHVAGCHTYLLDGDIIRRGLNSDLGYTHADRVENMRRTAEVAKLMVDAGLVVVVALTSPLRAEREKARALFAAGQFVEVFVDTPLSVAETRDPKQLYARARRGELTDFTCIDSPYEPPENPDVRIDTTTTSPHEAALLVLDELRR